eukprot:TRINITY_DN316_c0_g2_i1.p1 TRINITY_DN316_c0_g2~~TRINITY_DN316_c0_g2_i1.p1  ORF type:complete len:125 (-),score=2.57 TRINITY_DN316_c0_g2_i1:398-772(-)
MQLSNGRFAECCTGYAFAVLCNFLQGVSTHRSHRSTTVRSATAGTDQGCPSRVRRPCYSLRARGDLFQGGQSKINTINEEGEDVTTSDLKYLLLMQLMLIPPWKSTSGSIGVHFLNSALGRQQI